MAKVKITLEIEESTLNEIDVQHWNKNGDPFLYMHPEVTQSEFNVIGDLFSAIEKRKQEKS